ncbi:YTH domain-containing protein ECT4-like isoform X2 [Glycine soja]|uniref:YTH domain-containing family protein n=1 Tax=Glycine soja TaxID=3848 RepID=A0A445KPY5_GLYSO|nr:YTH domain-containing protein ECT4-like isoform X2 [Glycine soja]RZC12798.1 YTH domain-containing family protein 2 isoform C [Glycine soja]
MATVANPADQATDLLQKLSLETQPKPLEIPEPTKKATGNQYGSVDSGNAANGQIQSYDRSVTPVLQDFIDPTMCYLPNGYPSTAYYYGGYDGTGNEWDEYSRYVNSEGVEMTSGVYGDNGSLLYHHGYGYAPYGPYSPAGSPVPTMGNDGQLYGPQHYQYPPYFQPLTPTSAPFTPTPAVLPQGEVSTSVAADQKPLPVDAANGNSNGVANGGNAKGRGPTSGYQDPRFGFDGVRSPIPWLDAPLFSDGQPRPVSSTTITSSISGGNNTASRNPTFRPNSQFMGLHHPRPMPAMGATHSFINRMYPSKLYGQYGNTVRSGMGYGTHGYDSRTNGRAWLAVDSKYKTRGRSGGYFGYGNENVDGLNELNRGPRAKGGKNQKGFAPTILAVKGQTLPATLGTDEEKDKTSTILECDQYNKADFPEEYTDAKFFVIKSYSEDDIHKSIKYNVWASTQNGNEKLDAAYQEAQQKPGSTPVFLFFSVNTSGQFVGLAEMIGPVDFNKSVEYWQQDKWNGCFPLKWHIVKDVPNNLLRHITLDNNENKPVTNSRDTQEVMLEPGLKLIKIFKEYSSKTCILDDFGFYEARQKTILEKKAKQQFPKQVWEGKPADEKIEINGEVNTQKSEVSSELLKESTLAEKDSDDHKVPENGSATKTGEAPKGAKPVVPESKIVANGVVSNGV